MERQTSASESPQKHPRILNACVKRMDVTSTLHAWGWFWRWFVWKSWVRITWETVSMPHFSTGGWMITTGSSRRFFLCSCSAYLGWSSRPWTTSGIMVVLSLGVWSELSFSGWRIFLNYYETPKLYNVFVVVVVSGCCSSVWVVILVEILIHLLLLGIDLWIFRSFVEYLVEILVWCFYRPRVTL